MSYGVVPAELPSKLTARDLAHLKQLYNSSPWGPWTEDVRSARLQAFTLNSAFGSKGGAKPADFMLGSPPKASRKSRREAFKAWAMVASAAKKVMGRDG